MPTISTFADIHNFVIEEARIGTGSAASNEVNRLINMTYQDVAMEHRWRWLETAGATVVPKLYTTGTLTVANNSATFVGASTSFAASMSGRKVRLSSDEAVYQITTVSSATRLIMSASFRGTAQASAAYRMYRDVYTLPATCEEVIDVYTHQRGWSSMRTLEPITRRQMIDMRLAYPEHDDFAHKWSHDDNTSSGTRRFAIWPPAQNTRDYRLQYQYQRKVTSLSASSDTTFMPETYRSVLAYGALEKLFVQQGLMQRAQWARAEYNSKLTKMIDDGETTDRVVTLKPRGSHRRRIVMDRRRYDIDRDEWNY